MHYGAFKFSLTLQFYTNFIIKDLIWKAIKTSPILRVSEIVSAQKLSKESSLNVTLYQCQDQNSPIKLKKGVFAEQLTGTAFTVKRAENQKSWLYKVRPSVTQGQYKESTYPFKII